MATNTVFQYTTGKLELARTKNSFFGNEVWEFVQDIQDETDILEIKVFKYGNSCGVIKKLGYDKVSTLKTKGDTWYLVTRCGKPVLKNTDPKHPNKINPKYIELKELSYDFEKDNSAIQLKLNLIWE